MQFVGEASVPEMEAVYDVHLGNLGRIRRMIAAEAIASGLPGSRADDFALAVNEIACNAIVHGRPPASLSVRHEHGDLVCEVTDAGEGIEDLHTGETLPAPDASGGRGLWLSRQVCDEVEIRNDGGCTVSLRAAVPS